jgi:hypothetical protein
VSWPNGRRTSLRRSLPILAPILIALLVSTIRSEEASSAPGRVIVVDRSDPEASDANAGDTRRPVETIQQALVLAREYNARNIPVRVSIHPGIYREALAIKADEATTSAPLTLEGTADGVVVSGSDVWMGWTGGQDGVFTHPWSERWGLAPLPDGWEGQAEYLDRNPVIRRREMVFVGGHALLQVLSSDELRATEDSFFVSEDQAQILIHVPAATDVANSDVEVAIRPHLLQVASRQNITVENMTFQHAATPMPGAAVSFADSSHVTVTGSDFVWNSWTGIGLYQDDDVTIRDVRADHDGVSGITGSQIRALLIADSQISHNNWRGSRGWNIDDHSSAIDPNFIDFATGQKFFRLRDTTFRDLRSTDNLSGGIWLDSDNVGVTFDHVVLSGNLTHGLMVEASQGPISVVNSEICGNETGILSNNASNVRVTGNVLAGNILGQLFIAGANGPRPVVEFDTGQHIEVKTEDWVVQGNDMAVDDGQLASGTYLNGDLWSAYVDTLQSDHNHYSAPGSTDVFGIPGNTVDLRQWRSDTGNDAASTFSLGTSDCRVPNTQPRGTESPQLSGTAQPSPSLGPGDVDSRAIGKILLFGGAAALVGLGLFTHALFRRRRRRGSPLP